MAKYFSIFPRTQYVLDDSGEVQNAVKITANYVIDRTFKDNTVVYYSYVIKDGETPEELAHKTYGDVEKHWIILFMNDIIDPQTQWPLSQQALMNHIREQYDANAAANQTGLEWAQANVKSYYKVEQSTINGRYKSEQYVEIDQDQYDELVTGTVSFVLEDNSQLSIRTTKTTRSYYDYEVQTNDAKRTIKILKPEFATTLRSEFVNLFTSKSFE